MNTARRARRRRRAGPKTTARCAFCAGTTVLSRTSADGLLERVDRVGCPVGHGGLLFVLAGTGRRRGDPSVPATTGRQTSCAHLARVGEHRVGRASSRRCARRTTHERVATVDGRRAAATTSVGRTAERQRPRPPSDERRIVGERGRTTVAAAASVRGGPARPEARRGRAGSRGLHGRGRRSRRRRGARRAAPESSSASAERRLAPRRVGESAAALGGGPCPRSPITAARSSAGRPRRCRSPSSPVPAASTPSPTTITTRTAAAAATVATAGRRPAPGRPGPTPSSAVRDQPTAGELVERARPRAAPRGARRAARQPSPLRRPTGGAEFPGSAGSGPDGLGPSTAASIARASRDPRPHGAGRDVEHGGDLRVVEVAQVAEHDRDPELLGQLRQCGVDVEPRRRPRAVRSARRRRSRAIGELRRPAGAGAPAGAPRRARRWWRPGRARW